LHVAKEVGNFLKDESLVVIPTHGIFQTSLRVIYSSSTFSRGILEMKKKDYLFQVVSKIIESILEKECKKVFDKLHQGIHLWKGNK